MLNSANIKKWAYSGNKAEFDWDLCVGSACAITRIYISLSFSSNCFNVV